MPISSDGSPPALRILPRRFPQSVRRGACRRHPCARRGRAQHRRPSATVALHRARAGRIRRSGDRACPPRRGRWASARHPLDAARRTWLGAALYAPPPCVCPGRDRHTGRVDCRRDHRLRPGARRPMARAALRRRVEAGVCVGAVRAGRRAAAFARHRRALRRLARPGRRLLRRSPSSARLASRSTAPPARCRYAARGSRRATSRRSVSRPALGRGFLPADQRRGSPRVVVLSSAFWRQRYGGRRDVVGEIVRLSGEPYTIVGVMPPVTFPAWPVNPAAVTLDPESRQLWVPIPLNGGARSERPSARVRRGGAPGARRRPACGDRPAESHIGSVRTRSASRAPGAAARAVRGRRAHAAVGARRRHACRAADCVREPGGAVRIRVRVAPRRAAIRSALGAGAGQARPPAGARGARARVGRDVRRTCRSHARRWPRCPGSCRRRSHFSPRRRSISASWRLPLGSRGRSGDARRLAHRAAGRGGADAARRRRPASRARLSRAAWSPRWR